MVVGNKALRRLTGEGLPALPWISQQVSLHKNLYRVIASFGVDKRRIDHLDK